MSIRHTSASLTINENADPTVRTDMEGAFNRIVPETWNQEFFEATTHIELLLLLLLVFQHTFEGPDDMPAHVKSTLVGASFSVPVNRGSLQLGTWQGIYLCEHRDVGGFGVGHERDVTLTLPTAEISVQKQVTVTAPSRGCHDITAEVLKAASGEVSKLK
eukprot:3246747-Pyramimonas_sp.AAC.1